MSTLSERLITRICLSTIAVVFLAKIDIPIYMNTKFRDIGECMSVREIGKQRVFYAGQRNIFYFDNNSDGVLDQKWVNVPVSPMMGGPGYALFERIILDEDIQLFERANELYAKNLSKYLH